MAHVLVTGAAGFIGSHTVDRLLAGGHTVVGVDNFRTGRRANLAALGTPGFTFEEADILIPGVLDRLLVAAGFDAVIHLAALASVQESFVDPRLNYAVNVHATHLVAEAVRAHGVPRLVFGSSAAVYGDPAALPIREDTPTRPVSPYGAAKLAAESLLLGYGAAFGYVVRCQRYFNVFGPRQDPGAPHAGVIAIFDRRYRSGQGVTLFGDGRQTRDFIAVRDAARANVLAATRPGLASGVANICTGRATSIQEIAALFGRQYPEVDDPQPGPARRGDIRHLVGSPDEAARAFAFRAETTIEDGVTALLRAD